MAISANTYKLSGLTIDQIFARKEELERQVGRQEQTIKGHECVSLENRSELIGVYAELDQLVAECGEQRLVIVEQAVEISRLRRELNRCPE
jgi:uncharacterized coiled-coil protein SlyX